MSTQPACRPSGLRIALGLVLAYLLCALPAWAAPVASESVCGPAAALNREAIPQSGWQPGSGEIRRGQTCWLRFAPTTPRPELLSFQSVWIDVKLYDAAGQALAEAIRAGQQHNAIVSANRISVIVAQADFPLYARLNISHGSRFFDQVEVQSLNLGAAVLEARRYENLSIAHCAVLLSLSFVMAAFGLLLRDLNYGLFALLTFFRAAFVAFNNGLVFSAGEFPSWLFSLFILTNWPANALETLVVARLCGLASHSPVWHRAMLAISFLFLGLIPLELQYHNGAYWLQYSLELVWYPLALYGVWKAMRLHREASLLLFLGLLPLAWFWWPLALAAIVPVELGWNSNIPSGTVLDTLQVLFLPSLFCLSLAYRSLLLHKKAIRIAREDHLTGLPNRERLAVLGEQLLMAGKSPAVAALNIERFKAINETLGHDLGDATLVRVAHMLTSLPGSIVGRGQSDQFFIIREDPATLAALKHQLQQLFFAPLQIDGQTIDISLSVGLCADHDCTMRLRLHRAEIALHAARSRKSSWEIYRPEMESAARGDLRLLSELRTAIRENQLRLYLQPKVRLADGAVLSAEALVRWQHPERGMIPPGHFIPFAEHTGHISAITIWMLDQALRLVAAWRKNGAPLQISVNLSAFDLRNHDIVSQMEILRESHQALAGDLRLEITESGVMSDPHSALHVLNTLRAHGYTLALDDFGTGYSSLAYLQKMPVSELKIDRAFIAGVCAGSAAATLLQSTIELGQRLRLSVVTEGVESPEELALVRDFGCDYVQGWIFAKPMPVEEFLNWLATHQPHPLAQAAQKNTKTTHFIAKNRT